MMWYIRRKTLLLTFEVHSHRCEGTGKVYRKYRIAMIGRSYPTRFASE